MSHIKYVHSLYIDIVYIYGSFMIIFFKESVALQFVYLFMCFYFWSPQLLMIFTNDLFQTSLYFWMDKWNTRKMKIFFLRAHVYESVHALVEKSMNKFMRKERDNMWSNTLYITIEKKKNTEHLKRWQLLVSIHFACERRRANPYRYLRLRGSSRTAWRGKGSTAWSRGRWSSTRRTSRRGRSRTRSERSGRPICRSCS